MVPKHDFLYINGFILSMCHIYMASLKISLHGNVYNKTFSDKNVASNPAKGPFTIVNIYVFVQSVLILRPPSPLPKLVLLNVDYFRECSFSVSKSACHINIPLSMYIEDHIEVGAYNVTCTMM